MIPPFGKKSPLPGPSLDSGIGADDNDDKQQGRQVDAQQAGYMGPENGPFKCSHCEYFVADGKPCQKVADPIRAEGCCNLYEPKEEAMALGDNRLTQKVLADLG